MPAKVPMMDTGTAMQGMRVARQFCRKMNTTRNTRIMASTRVCTTSLMDSMTKSLVSTMIL